MGNLHTMVLLDIIQCVKEAVIGGTLIVACVYLPIIVYKFIKKRKDKRWEEEYKKFMDKE